MRNTKANSSVARPFFSDYSNAEKFIEYYFDLNTNKCVFTCLLINLITVPEFKLYFCSAYKSTTTVCIRLIT